jgi:osmoprotectant transport system ATP-binding protein
MIRLEGVGKRYSDGTVAVHELDLEVMPGEMVCLVGPSGCGKSTTLKMINRLIEPTSGRIFLEGRDVTSEDPVRLRRRIGYVIQQIGLFPHQTIATNVATVPSLLGTPKKQARARARELLSLVGLDANTYADRYPHQLSGGQQQRVGVARALAADPPVLLMDEPFAAVDPIVRARLQDEFLRLQAELCKTVVLVTHDIDEAVRMGDKVAVMAEGGHLAQFATPAELLGHPADDFVADFVGSTKGLRPSPSSTGHTCNPWTASPPETWLPPSTSTRPSSRPWRSSCATTVPWSASRTARRSSVSSPPTASTKPSAQAFADPAEECRRTTPTRHKCSALVPGRRPQV